MQKRTLISGAILMALAVAIGAFGAHGLKDMLVANNRLDTFETAVKYHAYHSLGLLIIGILMDKFSSKNMNIASNFMFWGILIFSGSLYTLCLTGIGWLGAITPIGGVLFIISWALVAWSVWKR